MAVSGQTMAWRVQMNAISAIKLWEFGVFNHVLPAFGDIERKSNQIANEEYNRIGSEPADEDCSGDMSAAAQSAEAKGQQFYEIMSSVRQTMINLVAAGLFHLIEQQLADLCRDGCFNVTPPSTGLERATTWYRNHFDLDLPSLREWQHIDELRLVANAIKHAEGGSASQLRELRPDLFRNPIFAPAEEFLESAGVPPLPLCSPLTGLDLYVTEEGLRGYFSSSLSMFEEISAEFDLHREKWYPISPREDHD
jgi:hypothetical protein